MFSCPFGQNRLGPVTGIASIIMKPVAFSRLKQGQWASFKPLYSSTSHWEFGTSMRDSQGFQDIFSLETCNSFAVSFHTMVAMVTVQFVVAW